MGGADGATEGTDDCGGGGDASGAGDDGAGNGVEVAEPADGATLAAMDGDEDVATGAGGERPDGLQLRDGVVDGVQLGLAVGDGLQLTDGVVDGVQLGLAVVKEVDGSSSQYMHSDRSAAISSAHGHHSQIHM